MDQKVQSKTIETKIAMPIILAPNTIKRLNLSMSQTAPSAGSRYPNGLRLHLCIVVQGQEILVAY
jgi:hypothetical protein